MLPDFDRKTVEVVAKRAAFLCSNPECRVSTVGPNTEAHKATVIGEAAHIWGARQSSARYSSRMSDIARGEVTNAIWLCRNCHRKIDQDPEIFPIELLFAWREQHERHVAERLGTDADKIRFDLEMTAIKEFEDYPPLIRRIIIDKADGWRFRLTAELLRHLNKPVLRRLKDLNANLYTAPFERVEDISCLDWIHERFKEILVLIDALSNTVNQIKAAWGVSGETESADEIRHVCHLVKNNLESIVRYEERLRFLHISGAAQPILSLLKNTVGDQAKEIEGIPGKIEKVFDLVGATHGGTKERPFIVKIGISFELPDGWGDRFAAEFKKLQYNPHLEA